MKAIGVMDWDTTPDRIFFVQCILAYDRSDRMSPTVAFSGYGWDFVHDGS